MFSSDDDNDVAAAADDDDDYDDDDDDNDDMTIPGKREMKRSLSFHVCMYVCM